VNENASHKMFEFDIKKANRYLWFFLLLVRYLMAQDIFKEANL